MITFDVPICKLEKNHLFLLCFFCVWRASACSIAHQHKTNVRSLEPIQLAFNQHEIRIAPSFEGPDIDYLWLVLVDYVFYMKA